MSCRAAALDHWGGSSTGATYSVAGDVHSGLKARAQDLTPEDHIGSDDGGPLQRCGRSCHGIGGTAVLMPALGHSGKICIAVEV